jgi:hypothetical protein
LFCETDLLKRQSRRKLPDARRGLLTGLSFCQTEPRVLYDWYERSQNAGLEARLFADFVHDLPHKGASGEEFARGICGTRSFFEYRFLLVRGHATLGLVSGVAKLFSTADS